MLGAQAGMAWMPDDADVSTQSAASTSSLQPAPGSEVCHKTYEMSIIMNCRRRICTPHRPLQENIRLHRPLGTAHWIHDSFNPRARALSLQELCPCPFSQVSLIAIRVAVILSHLVSRGTQYYQ